MQAVIQNLKNKLKTRIIYPITLTKAVYDENNKRLDNTLTDIQAKIGAYQGIQFDEETGTLSIPETVGSIVEDTLIIRIGG